MQYRISYYESGSIKKVEFVKSLAVAKEKTIPFCKRLRRLKPKSKGYSYQYSITKNFKFHVTCEKFGFEAGVEIHVNNFGEWIPLANYFKIKQHKDCA